MLSGATSCFESIGLVCAVIGGGRDVVCDNKCSMIDFPRQSIAAALRAEMHGYALMAEISKDDC